MTSLDELLERGEQAARPGRTAGSALRRQLRWAVKAVPAAAALGAALTVVMLMLGFELWYPVAAAAILAGLVLHRRVAGLAAPRPVPQVGSLERDPDRPDPDGLVPALLQWHARLRWDRAGRCRSGRTLQPSLAELVDERLRQRHGFTRTSDPDRARALLGERLWWYLASPPARNLAPRDLAALLTVVEEL